MAADKVNPLEEEIRKLKDRIDKHIELDVQAQYDHRIRRNNKLIEKHKEDFDLLQSFHPHSKKLHGITQYAITETLFDKWISPIKKRLDKIEKKPCMEITEIFSLKEMAELRGKGVAGHDGSLNPTSSRKEGLPLNEEPIIKHNLKGLFGKTARIPKDSHVYQQIPFKPNGKMKKAEIEQMKSDFSKLLEKENSTDLNERLLANSIGSKVRLPPIFREIQDACKFKKQTSINLLCTSPTGKDFVGGCSIGKCPIYGTLTRWMLNNQLDRNAEPFSYRHLLNSNMDMRRTINSLEESAASIYNLGTEEINELKEKLKQPEWSKYNQLEMEKLADRIEVLKKIIKEHPATGWTTLKLEKDKTIKKLKYDFDLLDRERKSLKGHNTRLLENLKGKSINSYWFSICEHYKEAMAEWVKAGFIVQESVDYVITGEKKTDSMPFPSASESDFLSKATPEQIKKYEVEKEMHKPQPVKDGDYVELDMAKFMVFTHKCNICGRKTREAGITGKICDMPQPDGQLCNGIMVKIE